MAPPISEPQPRIPSQIPTAFDVSFKLVLKSREDDLTISTALFMLGIA